MPCSDQMGKGMIANIAIQTVLYLRFATNYAVCLNIVCNSTVKQDSPICIPYVCIYIVASGDVFSCLQTRGNSIF